MSVKIIKLRTRIPPPPMPCRLLPASRTAMDLARQHSNVPPVKKASDARSTTGRPKMLLSSAVKGMVTAFDSR
jgi:hypothetical protein